MTANTLSPGAAPAATEPAMAWGPWITALMGFFLIAILFIVPITMGSVLGIVLAVTKGPAAVGQLEDYTQNGLFVSISSAMACLLCFAMLVVAIYMRRSILPQITVRRFLRLDTPVGARPLLGWIGILILYLLLMQGLSFLLERPLAPEHIVRLYQTAGFLPLLWLVLVIVSPVTEETLYRGFLLEGYSKTRRQTLAAIAIIAAVWAAPQLHFGWYDMLSVFGLGLLFGAARLHTGSLWTPLVLHMLDNLAAMIKTAAAIAHGHY